jgi:hypothetical protein
VEVGGCDIGPTIAQCLKNMLMIFRDDELDADP